MGFCSGKGELLYFDFSLQNFYERQWSAVSEAAFLLGS